MTVSFWSYLVVSWNVYIHFVRLVFFEVSRICVVDRCVVDPRDS